MNLHTLEQGAGPDLLLFHGNFGDAHDWDAAIPLLARHFHVIAVDLPGFGQSPRPDAPYDAAYFVAALRAFFQSRRLENALVVGHSLGGQLSVALSLAHPELISKLVLIAAGGFYQYPELHLSMLGPRFAESALAALTPDQVRIMFRAMFVNPSPDTEAYLDKQAALAASPIWPEVTRTASRSFHFHVDFCLLPHLTRFTTRTLLLWGENDAVVPVLQPQSVLPQLPNATLEVIPNCGHAPQIERPADVVARILPFLQQP